MNNPTQRDRPILILGAGINGAAIARELALNGVEVVVVDAGDLASGATAYSSRLIHGGLRYLEYGEFGLVRESLTERGRLLRLAPHFVRPLRLFIPVKRRWAGIGASTLRFLGAKKSGSPSPDRGLMLVRAGLTMYDAFAKTADMPRHAAMRVGEAGSLPVDENAYRWLCTYYDAQIEFPERFVVALLEDARRIAAARGGRFEVYTYRQARLAGDTATIDGVCEIQPAAVINATGAWVDRTLARLGVASKRLMGGTKGSHLVTSHAGLRAILGASGVYAEANDGRPVFILPLAGAVLIGTTDLPFDGDPAEARAGANEIDYLLGVVKQVFPHMVLTARDVDLHYSGVRPLPYVDSATPAGVTRRHWVEQHDGRAPFVCSVIGGKLTTCRSLAEETAALVLERLGIPIEANSRERPIPGGEDFPAAKDLSIAQSDWARRQGISDSQAEAIWRLVGRPASEWAARGDNLPGTSLPESFVSHVIEREWVTCLADLVERRLMLLYDPRLSLAALDRLADLLIAGGKLSESGKAAEVANCRDRLERHFGKRIE